MAEICKQWAPNVWAYRGKFITSCEATVQMFLIAGSISFVIGLFLGTLLTVWKSDGIRPRKILLPLVKGLALLAIL